MCSRSDFSKIGQLQGSFDLLVPNRKFYHKQIYIKTKLNNKIHQCYQCFFYYGSLNQNDPKKICQFNTVSLNSLINNFGNLHITSPTVLFDVEELPY